MNEGNIAEDVKLRGDEPVSYWREKSFLHWLWAALAGYWMIMFLAFGETSFSTTSKVLLCFILMNSSALLAGKTKQRSEREAKGMAVEHRMVQAIREAFGDSALIDHRVQAGEKEDLDIFVRFPSRQIMFAFSVKSWGQGKAVFNEKQGFLCFRRPGGEGLSRKDDPDPLDEILNHEWWLRRNNRGIFGGSSRSAKKPVRKAIVFAKPSIIQRHKQHRYSEIANHRYVFCERGKSSVFLISEEQLVDFIEDNLAAEELAKRPKPETA